MLRPDGYVHVEADCFAPGTLTTHRFRRAAGGRVQVNADASADLSDGEFYVKLRFHLDPGARLYSLTLDPPEVAVWGAPVPGRID